MKAPATLSMSVVLLAIVSGAVGSLGAAAFREALFELERLLHGNAGHLVAAAQALLWWQRLLFPCVGDCGRDRAASGRTVDWVRKPCRVPGSHRPRTTPRRSAQYACAQLVVVDLGGYRRIDWPGRGDGAIGCGRGAPVDPRGSGD